MKKVYNCLILVNAICIMLFSSFVIGQNVSTQQRIVPLLFKATNVAQKPSEILLYENKPDTKQDNQQEKKLYDAEGNLTHVSGGVTPRLFVYKPEIACGTGIIICPGGGYYTLNVENTRFIANRLIRMGITVFVLAYRLPANKSTPDKSTEALQDVQTAFRIVRNKAEEFGIDKNKIGLWGSSAGGHLAAMAATHFSTSYIQGTDTSGLKPDFLILAWPVTSLRPGLTHHGTSKNLLGGTPTEEQLHNFSPDEWVNARTPATFLVHASDDGTVIPDNSLRFYNALIKAKVPAELHIYEKGGHGFGIDPDIKESWMTQLEIWFRNRDLL